MKQIFTGDLSRLVCPTVGEIALRRLVAQAKTVGKVTDGPLTVLVAGREILAMGRYDPAVDKLTVDGYLR